MTFVLSLLPLPTFSQENISPPSSMMIRSPLKELHGRGVLICRVSPGCGGAAARMFLARAGAGAVVLVLVAAPRSRSRASIGSNCPVSLWVWSCGVTGSLVPQ